MQGDVVSRTIAPDEDITVTIIEIINELGNSPEEEFTQPLLHYVDPEALTQLISSFNGNSAEIEFTYLEYNIQIECTDQTTVTISK